MERVSSQQKKMTPTSKFMDEVEGEAKAKAEMEDIIINCIIHNSISIYLLFLLKDKEIYHLLWCHQ